ATIPLTKGIKCPAIEGRRVMKPSRAKNGSYRLILLTSLLASVVLLLQPTIAQPADGDTTITVAIPHADTGSQAEPSSNAPVVLRGTRPVTAAAAQVPTVRTQAPQPPYRGFRPAPSSPGGTTEYNSH